MKLSELADQIPGASLTGADSVFEGVNEPGRGRGDELEIWLNGTVDTDQPALVAEGLDVTSAKHRVEVPELQAKLPQVLSKLSPDPLAQEIAPDAKLSDDFQHGKEPSIGSGAVIGPSVTIGDHVQIEPAVSIRGNVTIGDHVTLRAGVRIESPARIGNGTTIHANSVIGADGFGYNQEEGTHHKIPQIGKVIIEKNVEVGALVSIDRAMFGETVIGEGTKIDNMVHIGHNCKIGKNVILISLTGISGSVDIGDNVTMAGQSGVKDHVHIADGVTVAGRGGVTKDIEEENAIVSGFPARDHRQHLQQQIMIRKLPDIRKQLKTLKQQMNEFRPRENQST